MLDKNNNKINFNINHKGKILEEVIQYSPAKYSSMLRAVYATVNALTYGRDGEKKKETAMREGFLMGMIAVLASTVKKSELENLSKISGVTEAILNSVDDERDILSMITASKDFVMNPPVRNKKRPDIKHRTKVVKVEVKDGEFDETQLDGLPDHIKKDILAEIKAMSK